MRGVGPYTRQCLGSFSALDRSQALPSRPSLDPVAQAFVFVIASDKIGSYNDRHRGGRALIRRATEVTHADARRSSTSSLISACASLRTLQLF